MSWIKNRIVRFFSKPLTLSEVLESMNKGECYFVDLLSKLQKTSIVITERKEDCFFAQFIEDKSEYVLCFDSEGKFLYIESEYWKDMDVKFNTRKLS